MLTDRMADHAAMQAYLEDLGGDNSAWRAAFREAFFCAMRDALTERQYEALRLHFIEGKSQKEIAALWGVSPSAVCRHLARGKKRLRHLLSYNLEFRA
ncbi:MAG: sigma-70 family RNA polymerase sigma factor [Butyricicoccus sp.]|nr:sigma-70 family RNA polymerase sigma factor [Butyricicoccus sp.]